LKVLVIGSKGFIGSNLLFYLNNTSIYNCWGCDILQDSQNDKYYFINHNNITFDYIFKNNQFDICINCSGSANVNESLINPLHDFELNVSNVAKILNSIRVHNSNCKFINLSSAAVYGNPLFLPIREFDKLNPLSPYGTHKILSEQLCFYYFHYFNVPTISLRIFSAYGPGLKKQIFWDWFCKSQSEDIVSLNGNGNESRDYIYIDDLVKVIDLTITYSLFDGSSINVANGRENYIKDIANIYFNNLDKNYHFNGKNNVANPLNWMADIELIKRWGYVSSTTIEDGLLKYIQWAKGLS
jgi:UDP-glucose 4-epimerase